MTVDYRQMRDKEYKGGDYKVDESLGKGPKDERKCTDCLCLIFFWIISGIMFYWCITSYVNGDPVAFVYPVSSENDICG